jgi:hypothetical protein
MSYLHLPEKSEHFTGFFQHTDPNAWVVLVLAISSLLAIFAALFFR